MVPAVDVFHMAQPQPTAPLMTQPLPHRLSCGQVGTFEEPQPPHKLTEGLPDTQSIEEQRVAYIDNLDAQFAQGTRMLEEHAMAKKRLLAKEAEHLVKQFTMQMEQQQRIEVSGIDQECEQNILVLEQSRNQNCVLLEQQANAAMMEFQQRQAQEKFEFQQYEYKCQLMRERMKAQTMPDLSQQYQTARRDMDPRQHRYPDVNLFDYKDVNHGGVISWEESMRAGYSNSPVRSVGTHPLCGVGLPQDSFGLGGRTPLGYMEHEQHQYRPMDRQNMERRQLPHPENNIFNYIDAAEVVGDSGEIFNKIDLNHDGKISREEFARAVHTSSQSCTSRP